MELEREKADQRNPNPHRDNSQRLVFTSFPWASWGLAGLFGFCFCYMVYHFAIGRNQYGRVFVNEEQITWWMILLLLFLGIMSLVFLFSGKVSTVVFDKRLQYLELRKTSIICRSNKKQGDLCDVFAITCYKKGFEGLTLRTIHY